MKPDSIVRLGLWAEIREAKGIDNVQKRRQKSIPVFLKSHEKPSYSSLIKKAVYRQCSKTAFTFDDLRRRIDDAIRKSGRNTIATLKAIVCDFPPSLKDEQIVAWLIDRSRPLGNKDADLLESFICPRRWISAAVDAATRNSKEAYSSLTQGSTCQCCGRFVGDIVNRGRIEENIASVCGRLVCRSKKCRAVSAYFKNSRSVKPLALLAIEELGKNANSENKRRLAKHFI